MSLRKVQIHEFLKLSTNIPLLDARSEKEWSAGHIPGSINFPVLNNEERTQVGLCYKQKGHEAAVILGYELVGPKFGQYIQKAYKEFKERKVLVHCFRGGLRSRILSYLLESAGFEVMILEGGYKQYRKWVLEKCDQPLPLKVLGGYTGSGKTEILQRLADRGFQIIDIEGLASHRGSAFGNIGLAPQPSQEQFENMLAHTIDQSDLSKTIWIEDEARMTGMLKMPDALYEQIRTLELNFLRISFEQRQENIMRIYGTFDKALLAASTEKLYKRLGDEKTRQALLSLEEGDYKSWLNIVLAYYDKTYLYGLEQREARVINYFESEKEFMESLTGSPAL